MNTRSLVDIENEIAELEEALLLDLQPESRLQIQEALERLQREHQQFHSTHA